MSGNVQLMSKGQEFEIAAAMVKSVPKLKLSGDGANFWIGNQIGLVDRLQSALGWIDHKKSPDGQPCKLCVPKGLTAENAVKILRCLGVEVYVRFRDFSFLKNLVRDPVDAGYIVQFPIFHEVGSVSNWKTVERLQQDNPNGITLVERILLEIMYFMSTGSHLDVCSLTLCTGSGFTHFACKAVPTVYYEGQMGRMVIDYMPFDSRPERTYSRNPI